MINAFQPTTKRQRYDILRSQLENERSSFLSHWYELSRYIMPRRTRFFISDVNKGDRRNSNIVDSTATLAFRTLQSGMMAGLSSPARPWFRLTTHDPALAEFGPVKDWLYYVTNLMLNDFNRSNFYNVLPTTYGDIGVFATGTIGVQEDFEDGITFTSFPLGSYMIGQDSKGRVNVFFREFRMTVRQLIDSFGRVGNNGQPDWSNFSIHVKNLFDTGNLETWVDVCHVVQPNPDYDDSKADSKFKRFTSCYYEKGYSVGSLGSYSSIEDRFLRESGYDNFPILGSRWETTGEDVYGTNSPGMIALGDIKQLQLGEKRMMQAIDKMVNPPMKGPPEMINKKASVLPGDITYVAERDGQKGFSPVYQVEPRIQELELKQQQLRQRISRAAFEDLFLMFANEDRAQVTAREVAERHEEKLFALGPMLEQQNKDIFSPLIAIEYDFLMKQGKIPEPPEELDGFPLKLEFVSVMAQAQKLVGVSGIERFVGFAGQIAQATGDMTNLDKIDIDQTLDVYAEMTSVPPGIIRSDEKVEEIRRQRAEAQAQQQKAQEMAMMAKSARDLGSVKTDTPNALTDLAKQMAETAA